MSLFHFKSYVALFNQIRLEYKLFTNFLNPDTSIFFLFFFLRDSSRFRFSITEDGLPQIVKLKLGRNQIFDVDGDGDSGVESDELVQDITPSFPSFFEADSDDGLPEKNLTYNEFLASIGQAFTKKKSDEDGNFPLMPSMCRQFSNASSSLLSYENFGSK